MKSLAINLKRIYLSPWNAILMVYNIMISIFVFVNANENCGQFIYYIFSFNIFLRKTECTGETNEDESGY